jgi:hypothetical protein
LTTSTRLTIRAKNSRRRPAWRDLLTEPDEAIE